MGQPQCTIALDVMGGDLGPEIFIKALDFAIDKYENVKFLVFGDENLIGKALNTNPRLGASCTLIHCPSYIKQTDSPISAVKNSKNTSMRCAIEAVKSRQADAVLSSGNTGALMALSKILLGTLPFVDRPAISGIFPNMLGKSIMLDLGANSECGVENLVQFAIMGNAFAKIMLNKKNPTIGLLNIGSESIKGNNAIKLTYDTLRLPEYSSLNFYGFIEGDDISKGTTDVIVADGFSGNIALKTAEGVAKMCTSFLFKKMFQQSIIAKILLPILKPIIKKTSESLDPRNYNGAILLGLNGVVIKSHGGADKKAILNALNVAIQTSLGGINDLVTEEIIESTDKIIQNNKRDLKE